ncbi:MAG: hypothetical protein HUJ98_13075 [Bacteroidaceae bacterium]|nr:hypothetical protein [Bacteroidaceae bacterium]
MVVNLELLREVRERKKVPISLIARAMKKSRIAVENKFFGKSPITVDEMLVLKKVLYLTDEEYRAIFML